MFLKFGLGVQVVLQWKLGGHQDVTFQEGPGNDGDLFICISYINSS